MGRGEGDAYTWQFMVVAAFTENIVISVTVWEHQIYLIHIKITNLFYN